MPRSRTPKVTVAVEGQRELSRAISNMADKQMRTEMNGEFRKAARKISERKVIPALHQAAASSSAPPQAKFIAATAKPMSDRWPRVKLGGKAGTFRDPRSPGDAPRYGAIFWGAVRNRTNNPKFRVSGDTWIGPTVRGVLPKALAEHKKALTQALYKEGLI